MAETATKDDIRERLLHTAVQVFAERDFHGATVRDVCRRCGANIAAINYHFGGKEALYVESWKYAFRKSLEKYPPDGGVPAGAPARRRLRGRVLAIVQRLTDSDSHDLDILHKEMASPTGLLTDVVHSSIEPMRRETRAVVRELLGEGATEQQVRLCQMSVMSQCFGPLLRERHRRRQPEKAPPAGPPPLDFDVEVLADHIARFSLAGIAEVRKQNRKLGGKKGRPE